MSFSTRRVTARDYLIVEVTAADGYEGQGFAYIGTSGAEVVASYVENILSPTLLALACEAPKGVWPRLYHESLLLGRGGLGMRALAAVDIALWDLLAKRCDAPLHRVLGLADDDVAAYASGGYYGKGGDPVEDVHDEFTVYAELGFQEYKIKVGGAALDVDLARVAAAREVVGAQGELALDCNNAWRSAWDALAFARSVAEFDIRWIEEPLAPEDFAGHAELARRTDIPVATGELLTNRRDFRELIDRGGASVIQADAGVMGGITEWSIVAGLARANDLVLAPHWHANLHSQLIAGAGSGEMVEYFSERTDIFNFERLLTADSKLVVRDGRVVRSQLPGVGVVFDPGALAEYAA